MKLVKIKVTFPDNQQIETVTNGKGEKKGKKQHLLSLKNLCI